MRFPDEWQDARGEDVNAAIERALQSLGDLTADDLEWAVLYLEGVRDARFSGDPQGEPRASRLSS